MRQEHIETLRSELPGEVILAALNRLLEADRDLFEIDANERSITHRLATYIQELLPDLHVDCEYNRDGINPKELHLPELNPDKADSDAQTVYPDIIVHRRRTNENYLVIETKKTSSRIGHESDFAKLDKYKNQLGYKYALFIEFSVRPHEPGINNVLWMN
jgi:hypothetical protein